jgi:uncharacterized membrane protein
MGEGFGAVFPVVIVGIVADLLVNLFLNVEIVGLGLRGPIAAGPNRAPKDVLLFAHHGQPLNA